MWNEPTAERLSKIPELYSEDDTPLKDKKIYLHFFIGNSDWYIAEYDGDNLFFGYAILNGDLRFAEWGLIPFDELKNIKINGFEIDCEKDFFWEVKPFKELEIN